MFFDINKKLCLNMGVRNPLFDPNWSPKTYILLCATVLFINSIKDAFCRDEIYYKMHFAEMRFIYWPLEHSQLKPNPHPHIITIISNTPKLSLNFIYLKNNACIPFPIPILILFFYCFLTSFQQPHL